MSHRLPQTRVPVSLRRLFPHASFVGCADICVSGATERSDQCDLGMLFAAIPGTRVDGCEFAQQVVTQGASSLLVERPLSDVSVPQCVVPNVRKAYAELCAELAGRPSSRLKVFGVTGTNGKTTVAWLIRSILETAGQRVGLLGTIEYSDGFVVEPARMTTPDSKTFSERLEAMLHRGTEHVAVELSSHALDQDRCAGTLLNAAVITNITHDHFDYHKNFEAYRASKARILENCKRNAVVVLNADDPASASLREKVDSSLNLLTYALNGPADVSAEVFEETRSGSRFKLSIGDDTIEVFSPLVGRHNVSNCLAAAAVTSFAGLPLYAVAAGIETLSSVPGRLQQIEHGQPFEVFVDYAHTDDALRRSINCLRNLTTGRVICVFGAGGDRDRSKRPLLGRAGAEADLTIVTSDNPRTEDPTRIIQDILSGFEETGQEPYIKVDRAEAINWALQRADPGDCVLIAGKGHEKEQIVGTRRIPFDDCVVARQALFRRDQSPVETRPRMRA